MPPSFWTTSPLPDDIEAAKEEIVKLRRQLHATNEKYERLYSRRELEQRSLRGQLRTVEKLLGVKLTLDKGVPSDTVVFVGLDGKPLKEIRIGRGEDGSLD